MHELIRHWPWKWLQGEDQGLAHSGTACWWWEVVWTERNLTMMCTTQLELTGSREHMAQAPRRARTGRGSGRDWLALRAWTRGDEEAILLSHWTIISVIGHRRAAISRAVYILASAARVSTSSYPSFVEIQGGLWKLWVIWILFFLFVMR
jgi:hypothetical protein